MDPVMADVAEEGESGSKARDVADFSLLVALCVTIPSRWTQQVLEDFESIRDVVCRDGLCR
jgi:hypothetical protein